MEKPPWVYEKSLNENPAQAMWATVALIVAAVIFVAWYNWQTGHSVNTPREFFSDDDGQTWFSDTSTRLAPFDHNGKEAVLAKVFKAHDGTRFVGFLEKFTEDAKKRIADARATGRIQTGIGSVVPGAPVADLLVKKTHGGKWVDIHDPLAIDIQTVHSPDGSSDFEPVLP